MNSAFFTQQIGIQRTLVASTFVDTCEIKRVGTSTIDSMGVTTPATRTNVQYLATNNVICRIEPARAFMNDKDKFQTVVTDNYMMMLPYDIDVVETDEIIWNGKTFDIRKILLAGAMDAYVEVLLVHTTKNN